MIGPIRIIHSNNWFQGFVDVCIERERFWIPVRPAACLSSLCLLCCSEETQSTTNSHRITRYRQELLLNSDQTWPRFAGESEVQQTEPGGLKRSDGRAGGTFRIFAERKNNRKMKLNLLLCLAFVAITQVRPILCLNILLKSWWITLQYKSDESFRWTEMHR